MNVHTVIPYTQDPPYYAQWGEDRWLAEHLALPATGVFVDVGAGDGRRGSNTLYFENLGWTGLCIDADSRNHAALRRRRCVVATCAVAYVPGRRPFGMYQPKPSWSGLARSGPGYLTVSVDCRRLDDLLDEAQIGVIDLLSIDVEGTELDVWNSFDAAAHRPSIVIIEYDDSNPERHRDSIRARLGSTYELLHRTPSNLILARIDEPGRIWRTLP